MEITLPSGRKIGENQEPFIIAEVGSNWSSLDDCLTSISMAKACTADAVKFQAYDKGALYGIWNHPPDFTEIERLPGQLPTEWIPKLSEKAKAVGIEFMCSAFSPELIEAVDPYVNIHKVASSEMCHVRMLEKLRDIGKPVFLSTGAQHADDIQMALNVLVPAPTVVMYCPAAYPSKECDASRVISFKIRFHQITGYSDHTTDVFNAPLMARSYGADVFEKHVNFVGAKGPDAPHSLNPDEFKRMAVALSTGRDLSPIGPTKEEDPFILRHKRRLIATRPIQQGEVLVEGDNFGIYRSLKNDTHAFSPFLINQVNGKIAKKEILAGDGIGPGDV